MWTLSSSAVFGAGLPSAVCCVIHQSPTGSRASGQVPKVPLRKIDDAPVMRCPSRKSGVQQLWAAPEGENKGPLGVPGSPGARWARGGRGSITHREACLEAARWDDQRRLLHPRKRCRSCQGCWPLSEGLLLWCRWSPFNTPSFWTGQVEGPGFE